MPPKLRVSTRARVRVGAADDAPAIAPVVAPPARVVVRKRAAKTAATPRRRVVDEESAPEPAEDPDVDPTEHDTANDDADAPADDAEDTDEDESDAEDTDEDADMNAVDKDDLDVDIDEAEDADAGADDDDGATGDFVSTGDGIADATDIEYIYVPADERRTCAHIGAYALAALISIRTEQIARGGMSTVDSAGCATSEDVAKREIAAGLCPIMVRRKVGEAIVGGKKRVWLELWRASELVMPLEI